MKADRNKTIDISVEEGREYLERCPFKLEEWYGRYLVCYKF